MTEQQIRASVVETARSYLGYNEADGSHRAIIDLYNSHKPLARGYKVTYTDPWCATFVSAVAIQCGLTDIMPTECSCTRMISLHQSLGSWEENDNYVPQPGDILMYDWDDAGAGENRNGPEHVGIVVKLDGMTMTIIEGNYKNAVTRRTVQVNGRYIRGYCVPKYASKAVDKPAVAEPVAPEKTNNTKKGDYTMEMRNLKKGCKGEDVRALQILLMGRGYSVGNCGADGDFGKDTLAAVKAYQKKKGLAVDGIAGKNTMSSLLGVK